MIYQITVSTIAGMAVLITHAKDAKEAQEMLEVMISEIKNGRITVEAIQKVPEITTKPKDHKKTN
jgi:hypothetical protein